MTIRLQTMSIMGRPRLLARLNTPDQSEFDNLTPAWPRYIHGTRIGRTVPPLKTSSDLGIMTTQRRTTALALEVLAEADTPLHYTFLTLQVILRGARLRGKTPWMTLRTRLARDSRFERVGAPARTGMFALASWPAAKKVVPPGVIAAVRKKAAMHRQQIEQALQTLPPPPSTSRPPALP